MSLPAFSQERETTVAAVRAADEAMLRIVWSFFPQAHAAFAKVRDARRRARAVNRKIASGAGGAIAPVDVPLNALSDEQFLGAIRALEDLERALQPARRAGVSRG